MSYRDLRPERLQHPGDLFEAACRYAQYLWLQQLPARSLLALCRALYLDPDLAPTGSEQPYKAVVWILRHAHMGGFLGNPRVSFFHQAVRTNPHRFLQRERAAALWYLTRRARPDLPPDPEEWTAPPRPDFLAHQLDDHGLPGEGSLFEKALQEPFPGSPSSSAGPS
jgi:hypothetical protein